MVQNAPAAQGLYDPQFEHDACGIGAVVDISGTKSHKIVDHAKQILLNLQHRGASGADESTGDGAGILMQIPHEFFAAEADRLNFELPSAGQYGAGILFLPPDPALRGTCEEVLAQALESEGLEVLGWRDVPCDNRTLGDIARSAEPIIRQIFVASGGLGRGRLSGEQLERRLFRGRKRAERRARVELGITPDAFYIPSLSCRTIIYKGMFLAPQLFAYYPDLADPDMTTALAMVHQRYSTNTFPSWRLAQPFRMIAHNGEINTLRGNLNRLKGYEKTMACPALGKDLSNLFPIVEPGGSDSACFDNCMELLVRAGRSARTRADDDDSRGFWARLPHFARQAGILRVPRRAAGTLGWAGGDALYGRPTGGRDLGPQRPASQPLRRHQRRTRGVGQRSGRDRVPARTDRAQGPPAAGTHVPRRYRGRPHRRRQRNQGQDRPPEALSPLAGEPHRTPRTVPAGPTGRGRSRQIGAAFCEPSVIRGKICK